MRHQFRLLPSPAYRYSQLHTYDYPNQVTFSLAYPTVAYVQDDLHRSPEDCNINRSVELHYAKINDHLGFCYPLELNYDQHIVRMPMFSPNLSPSLRVLALPSYPLHLG